MAACHGYDARAMKMVRLTVVLILFVLCETIRDDVGVLWRGLFGAGLAFLVGGCASRDDRAYVHACICMVLDDIE